MIVYTSVTMEKISLLTELYLKLKEIFAYIVIFWAAKLRFYIRPDVF